MYIKIELERMKAFHFFLTIYILLIWVGVGGANG